MSEIFIHDFLLNNKLIFVLNFKYLTLEIESILHTVTRATNEWKIRFYEFSFFSVSLVLIIELCLIFLAKSSPRH